jgi:hypothetical protein
MWGGARRDSRRVMSLDSDGAKNGRKPDGNMCELERKADILIYEASTPCGANALSFGPMGRGALVSASAPTRLLPEL